MLLKFPLESQDYPWQIQHGMLPPLTVTNLWEKVSIFCSPSLFYEVQYLLHTIGSLLHYSLWYMIIFQFLWPPWLLNFSFYIVFYTPYSQPWLPIFFTPLNCLPKKGTSLSLCWIVLVHLDITLQMFNWQYKFNMMKTLPKFLTWITYLLNFPGRSYLL